MGEKKNRKERFTGRNKRRKKDRKIKERRRWIHESMREHKEGACHNVPPLLTVLTHTRLKNSHPLIHSLTWGQAVLSVCLFITLFSLSLWDRSQSFPHWQPQLFTALTEARERERETANQNYTDKLFSSSPFLTFIFCFLTRIYIFFPQRKENHIFTPRIHFFFVIIIFKKRKKKKKGKSL